MSEPARHSLSRARAAAAIVAVSLAIPVAALALPDVGELNDGAADTPNTPRGKESNSLGYVAWSYVAGAPFNSEEAPEPGYPKDSPTPTEVDFHDVAMSGESSAYAVGSLDVGGANRVPVIYRYTKDARGDEVWEEVHRGTDRGYVARVVWVDRDTVLAVGGDGDYPEREKSDGSGYCAEGEDDPGAQDSAENGGAGRGRVWILEAAREWRELGEDELPPDLRALTALDSYYAGNPATDLSFAVAGGLCQLWHIRDGEFMREGDSFAPPWDVARTETVPPAKPEYELQAEPALRLRVRDIRFADSAHIPLFGRQARAMAVTSGCCVSGNDQQLTNPLLIHYEPPSDTAVDPAVGTWRIRRESYGHTASPSDADPLGMPDSIYGAGYVQTRPSKAEPWAAPQWTEAVLLTPARPEPSGPDLQPPSRWAQPPNVANPFGNTPDFPAAHPFSSVRLVDAAGNDEIADGVGTPGFPDWAVGVLRSSGQAVALGTNAQHVPAPPPTTDARGPCATSGSGTNTTVDPGCASQLTTWEPTTVEQLEKWRGSYTLLKLPIHSAAAVDIDDQTGLGWAVGRYGGIARYNDGRSELPPGSEEPQPPRVGSSSAAAFPSEPYSAFGDLPRGAPGEVRALASQPRQQLDRPQLHPHTAVSQNANIRDFVTSGDGREGWAVAGTGETSRFLRYRDGEWRPCYGEPLDGDRFPADPACSAFLPKSVTMFLRIPTEDGGAQPAAVAKNQLYVFSDGAWRLHPHQPPAEKKILLIAFASPTLGLMRHSHDPSNSNSSTHQGQEYWLYDATREGEKWVNCTQPPPLGQLVKHLAVNCGDHEGRLDFRIIFPIVGETHEIFGNQGGTPTPVITSMDVADGRIYLSGSRVARSGYRYPLIVVFDGKTWSVDPAIGGMDPGCPRIVDRVCQDPVDADGREMGFINALEADPDSDEFSAWAFGVFGERRPLIADRWTGVFTPGATDPIALAARFHDGKWEPFRDSGPTRDYPPPRYGIAPTAAVGNGGVVVARDSRLLRFNEPRSRFDLVEAGRRPASSLSSAPDGGISALTGVGGGEGWAAVGSYLFRYTDSPHQEVFDEVAHPIRDVAVSGTATGPDGSLWAATLSDRVYRHDPLTGWESVRIKGWDAGRIVTRRAPAYAVAAGASGEGLVVGEGGRIARIDPEGVSLDRATGKLCDLAAPVPPCSTGRNLRSAAVGPDGSALVGGDRRILLWRPAGGDFRTIEPPPVTARITFTAMTIPAAGTAWVATSDSRIFKGTLGGAGWSWQQEAREFGNKPVATDRSLTSIDITGIAIRSDGSGIAVGDRGVIVERSASGEWTRVDSGVTVDLSSLAAVEGGGAIAGGLSGVIVTRIGGVWRTARAPRFGAGKFNRDGDIVGVGLAPGLADGEIDAWAVTVRESATRVWRHASSDDPALDPDRGMEPLPDAPAPRAGELRFATWGKTDCPARMEWSSYCREMNATDSYYETIARRIVDEIAVKTEAGELDGSFFTGDTIDTATHAGNRAVGEPTPVTGLAGPTMNGRKKLARWRELIADRMDDADVPFFVGIGGQDLSDNQLCAGLCVSGSRFAKFGENLVWRGALDGRVGSGPAGPAELEQRGLVFRQLSSSSSSIRHEDVRAPGVEESAPTGGADTHFAIEVDKPGEPEPLSRIVFADTSLRSLSASDPLQQPFEPRGGQTLWLERMLCFAPGRAADGQRCTRSAGQPAVVVTNTPSHTPGPGTFDTQPDGASFEALMMRHRVSAVVSGRIGWNGLYWTLAPGLHTPCWGQGYSAEPPADSTRPCQGDAPGGFSGGPPEAAALSDALRAAGAPAAPEPPPEAGAGSPFHQSAVTDSTGPPIPFVVSSGGGGKVASEGESGGDASDGYWQGYSVVRLAASGNSRETIVEQRPVYDFVTLDAQTRSLKPGQRMTLRGWARGPGGFHEPGGRYIERWDRIESAAVTHRYDLLLADQERPWLPQRDGDGEYVMLEPSVATIDSETGRIRAGRGRQERTFALGVLSVGDEVASYPLVFEPSKSFKPRPAAAATIRPPVVQPPPVQPLPPIQVLSQPPTQPPATPPPPAQLPTIGDLALPAPPQLPGIAALPATAPSPAPPPPPIPPPPPNSGTGLPLNLNAPISPVSIVPTVIPPTPPPINPAPPGGSAARKEAKQRQAATAKSEESANQLASEGGDLATDRTSPDATQALTRRDRIKPGVSFTPRARTSPQASAWTRAALYGGGLTVLAFTLAAGWIGGRPGPRRSPPTRPAPAWAQSSRRWRRRP